MRSKWDLSYLELYRAEHEECLDKLEIKQVPYGPDKLSLEAEPYDQLQVDDFLEAEPISTWWFLEVDPLEVDGSALVTTLLGQKVCKSVSKILK